jgi:hypothetical protein
MNELSEAPAPVRRGNAFAPTLDWEVSAVDELVNLVSQKTGLAPEQARGAAEAVLGFLKERLPAPLAGHIDSVVSGPGSGGLSDLANRLGGLFGNK